jgi:hypothetical protein
MDWKKAWKEAVLDYFKVPCRHFSGGNEENHEINQSGRLIFGQRFERGVS